MILGGNLYLIFFKTGSTKKVGFISVSFFPIRALLLFFDALSILGVFLRSGLRPWNNNKLNLLSIFFAVRDERGFLWVFFFSVYQNQSGFLPNFFVREDFSISIRH